MEIHYWYVLVIIRSVHQTTQVLNTLDLGQTRCIRGPRFWLDLILFSPNAILL